MTDEKAREILKRHAAAWGDSKYEPARWVIDALRDAVESEREECAQACLEVAEDGAGLAGEVWAERCCTEIRKRSNV